MQNKKKTDGWEELSYTLTREEWRVSLSYIQRKAGLGRMIVQSVLLLALAAYCFIPFLAGEHGSWLVTVASLLLLAVQWIAPEVIFRRQAAERDVEKPILRLWLSDTAVAVGTGSDRVERTITDCREEWRQHGDMLYWQVGKETVIPLPRRVLTEEQAHRLLG